VANVGSIIYKFKRFNQINFFLFFRAVILVDILYDSARTSKCRYW